MQTVYLATVSTAMTFRGIARSDVELVGQFVSLRDELAFSQLLQRHSAMVYGVCQRVLGNHHLAEDAFQATFLVFAKKASSLKNSGSLAAWLHGVARRVSLKARTRMKTWDVLSHEPPQPDQGEPLPADVKQYLDEEIQKLPARLREVIICCYLEGQSKTKVANLLRAPVGTISSRLTRARELLRKRLAKRGVLVTSLVALERASSGLLASPPTTLLETLPSLAVKSFTQPLSSFVPSSIYSLTQGVTPIMKLSRMFLLSSVTALSLAAGTGLWAYKGQDGAAAAGGSDGPAGSITVAQGKQGESKTKPGSPPAKAAPAKVNYETGHNSNEVIHEKLQAPLGNRFATMTEVELPLGEMLAQFEKILNVKIVPDGPGILADGGSVDWKAMVRLPSEHMGEGATVESMLLKAFENCHAKLLVRGGKIAVLSENSYELRALSYPVSLPKRDNFRRLSEILDELSEAAGVSILIDQRVLNQVTKVEIGWKFHNVPFATAVRLLCDQAELGVAMEDNLLYVTTPERAISMNTARANNGSELPKGFAISQGGQGGLGEVPLIGGPAVGGPPSSGGTTAPTGGGGKTVNRQ